MPGILLERFSEFKVAASFNGKRDPVILVRPEEREFLTVLREGASVRRRKYRNF